MHKIHTKKWEKSNSWDYWYQWCLLSLAASENSGSLEVVKQVVLIQHSSCREEDSRDKLRRSDLWDVAVSLAWEAPILEKAQGDQTTENFHQHQLYKEGTSITLHCVIKQPWFKSNLNFSFLLFCSAGFLTLDQYQSHHAQWDRCSGFVDCQTVASRRKWNITHFLKDQPDLLFQCHMVAKAQWLHRGPTT